MHIIYIKFHFVCISQFSSFKDRLHFLFILKRIKFVGKGFILFIMKMKNNGR